MELIARLEQLRDVFLPAEFDPTGTYSDEEIDFARAYRMLAHAEIEACLEELGSQTVQAAYDRWLAGDGPGRCLLALVAYHDKKVATPTQLSEVGEQLEHQIRDARDVYVRRMRVANHGIRERNVLAILLPVGVLATDIDGTWLNTMDSFGSQRGDTAHRAAGQTQQPPDPKEELSTVQAIVDGLNEIDAVLDELRPD
jgi:hypothetical protein